MERKVYKWSIFKRATKIFIKVNAVLFIYSFITDNYIGMIFNEVTIALSLAVYALIEGEK